MLSLLAPLTWRSADSRRGDTASVGHLGRQFSLAPLAPVATDAPLIESNVLLASSEVRLGPEDRPNETPPDVTQPNPQYAIVSPQSPVPQPARLAPLVASELIYNATFDATMLDHLVQLLEDAGFEGDGLVDAYNVVFAAMCGFATMELSTAPAEDAEAWENACRAQIARVDAVRQPALARHLAAMQNRAFVLRWSSGDGQPLDSGFEAWVDVIVRGVESRARALRRAAAG